MTGYRPEPKTYRLTFPDHPGLEVTCGSPSLGDLLEILSLADAVTTTAITKEQAVGLFGWFARFLTEWNLEDAEGAPVPKTLEGILTQDFGFVLNMVMAWVKGIAGVAPPLPAGSSNGASSGPVPSLPMEARSPSRGS
jgi:hypothetical protein